MTTNVPATWDQRVRLTFYGDFRFSGLFLCLWDSWNSLGHGVKEPRRRTHIATHGAGPRHRYLRMITDVFVEGNPPQDQFRLSFMETARKRKHTAAVTSSPTAEASAVRRTAVSREKRDNTLPGPAEIGCPASSTGKKVTSRISAVAKSAAVRRASRAMKREINAAS